MEGSELESPWCFGRLFFLSRLLSLSLWRGGDGGRRANLDEGRRWVVEE